jgi:DNA-binding response OmpR family regulator
MRTRSGNAPNVPDHRAGIRLVPTPARHFWSSGMVQQQRETGMAVVHPILIVDDDVSLRNTLAAQLDMDGQFETSCAGSLAEAEGMLRTRDGRYDLLVLDIKLPDGDGRDFCARLRRQEYKMPIVLLTGCDDETDIVRGLDSGANDYITKPFRLSELLARVRAQLRFFESSEHATYTIGDFTFQPAAKMLRDRTANRRIRLTEKEAKILRFLYRAGNTPVLREVLLNEVWGYNNAITTHTLETHIYRLRQKMEQDPSNATMLITERGGYRLDPHPPASMPVAA